MCDLDEYEAPDEDEDGEINYDETPVVVENPTKCRECRRKMAAGSTMKLCSGVWGGKPEAWHHCQPCAYMLGQPEGSTFHMCPGDVDNGYKVPEWIEAVTALHEGREPQGPLLQEHQMAPYGAREHPDPKMEASNDRLKIELRIAWNKGRHRGQ
jgi:hypothetical protein